MKTQGIQTAAMMFTVAALGLAPSACDVEGHDKPHGGHDTDTSAGGGGHDPGGTDDGATFDTGGSDDTGANGGSCPGDDPGTEIGPSVLDAAVCFVNGNVVAACGDEPLMRPCDKPFIQWCDEVLLGDVETMDQAAQFHTIPTCAENTFLFPTCDIRFDDACDFIDGDFVCANLDCTVGTCTVDPGSLQSGGYCCKFWDCNTQGVCTGSGGCTATDNSQGAKNSCANSLSTHITCKGEKFNNQGVQTCTPS